jgi:uncharacterized protein YndB with AHSA1/START domain
MLRLKWFLTRTQSRSLSGNGCWGPEGWTMPVCEIDLRVGGKYRYVWKKETAGIEMGMGGEFREVARPEKYVATEKFDESWYPGEGLSTTTFEDRGGKTYFQNVMQYESESGA